MSDFASKIDKQCGAESERYQAADDLAVNHDLAYRAAERARWVAALLVGVTSADPATAEIVDYLESYADTVQALSPRVGHGQSFSSPLDTPIDRVAGAYGLSDTELNLLLLAGLPHEHEGMARTFRNLHPLGEPQLSVGLAAQILCAQHGDRAQLEAVLFDGPAFGSGLLRLGPGPGLYERSVVVADALWPALAGSDGAWPDGIERVPLVPTPFGLEEWLLTPDVAAAGAALSVDDDRLLVISTPDEALALSRLAALADIGRPIVVARTMASDTGSVNLAALHAVARGARLAILVQRPAEGATALEVDVAAVRGPVVVVTPGFPLRSTGRRPSSQIPLGPITPKAHRRAWEQSLGLSTARAAFVAARHAVDPSLIAVVAGDVRAQAGGQVNEDGDGRGDHHGCDGATADLRDIAVAIRNRIGLVLPPGCQLLTPGADWSRLVLPPGPDGMLREAVDRLHNQSTVLDDWGFLDGARANRGARLLFTGPPGTGKSLAAEVLADELGVDLLVADLSQVVSKWLGETEKNLAALFDAAERSLAVLRFDEADALFTSRTSVSDANDRYANLETAYLLQRLDDFDGLAILTTNLKKNIDRAVLRRMDAVIEFPVPDEPARVELWRVHLPASAPLESDVELAELAETYEMPGAWIRNAAIAAAFLAAAEGSAIAQRHLLAAVSREYQKASRPFPGEPQSA